MKQFPLPITQEEAIRIADLITQIQQWGVERDIIGPNEQATLKAQIKKMREEVDETADAVANLNGLKILFQHVRKDRSHNKDLELLALDEMAAAREEITDGIGDQLVVIIMQCALHGITVEEALIKAYTDIKDRKGKMINGTFVKEST